MAPDLVVHMADYAYTIDWYIPATGNGGGGESPIVDRLTGRYAVNCGSHRPTGILMLQGPDIRRGLKLGPNRIYDVAPTLLYMLGEPVPADLDGRILTEAIMAERIASQPSQRSEPGHTSDRQMPADDIYSDADAEAVSERLRSLGYL